MESELIKTWPRNIYNNIFPIKEIDLLIKSNPYTAHYLLQLHTASRIRTDENRLEDECFTIKLWPLANTLAVLNNSSGINNNKSKKKLR